MDPSFDCTETTVNPGALREGSLILNGMNVPVPDDDTITSE